MKRGKGKILVKSRSHGFSLVELLVVIGVLGVLMGLLLPAIQRIRASATQSGCMNNLRQIGTALHHYHGIYGKLPEFCGFTAKDPNLPVSFVSWMASILPQMDQEALWSATHAAMRAFPTTPLTNPPHIGLNTVIKQYICPADGRLNQPLETKDRLSIAFTSYIGVSAYSEGRSVGIFDNCPGISLADITDGTSNTLAVGERPPPDTLQAGPWYPRLAPATKFWGNLYGPDEFMEVAILHHFPRDSCTAPYLFGPGRVENPCDRYHFWSLHVRGANFLFADGSVRFLSYQARVILPALATRAGGELVELPW